MKTGKMLKRVLCLVLIVVTLAISVIPAFAAGGKGSYVVTASRLNVHSSASLGGVKAKLKKGAVVTYKSSKNGWWYVSYGGGSGYVDKRYLRPVGSSIGTKTPASRYVTTANLRVRSRASIKGVVLGKLKKGKKVQVLGQSGSWARISYKGKTGWVSTKYLKKAK